MKLPFPAYLLFLLSSLVHAQDKENILVSKINFYRSTVFNWTTIDKKAPADLKNNLLTKIFADSTDEYCQDAMELKTAAEFRSYYEKNFHLVDLDHDNDYDLIFSGLECPGVEGGMVNIYINKNGNYKKSLSTKGKIADVTGANEFIVYEYPCCAMIQHSLIFYKIQPDTILLLNKISFFDFFSSQILKNAIPKILKANGEIPVSEKTILYISPQDSLTGTTLGLKTSRIGYVSKAGIATIFARQVDRNGQRWCYCSFKGSDIIMKDERISSAIVAWIKK